MHMQYMRENIVFALLITLTFLIIAPLLTEAQSERQERQERLLKERVRQERLERPERFGRDEILVKFKGDDRFDRVRNTNDEDIGTLVERYRSRGDVVYAEPNYIAYTQTVPTDPLYSYQWHFDNAGYGGVHAEAAWDYTDSSGVIIAVIDTGIAYENYQQSRRNRFYLAPDLAGTTFIPGYDFVNNDTHPNDDEGHGTHVAGTLAQSTNNGIGTAGLAHGASLMPVKVLDSTGSGSYADVAEGIYFAANNGADVINLSLGGPSSSSALEEALAYAYGKGVTIVAAAGNNGTGTLSYPAAYNAYVIAVGATRYDETLTSYSNYGPGIDIVAPGGDTSVDQNGDGYGDGILQQTFENGTNDWGYYFYEGTSMASPHVAAAAALVIAHGVASTPDGVRNVLEGTADDLGQNDYDIVYGHGLLNAGAALAPESVAPPPPPPEPEPENAAPTITSSPITEAIEGTLYSYDVDASDPEGDSLTYSLSVFPAGMTIDAASGEISWTPANSQVGVSSTTVVATATGELFDEQSFEITVAAFPPPSPPPPPETEVIAFSDSFEDGLNQWTQDSQDDWDDSRQRATDGRRSAQVDGSANDAALMSGPIDLQEKTNAAIRFSWLIERRLDSGEYMAFDISTDGGTTWAEYDRLRGNVEQEDAWYDEEFTLTDISELQIRFRGTMSRGNEDANVDNVQVVAF